MWPLSYSCWTPLDSNLVKIRNHWSNKQGELHSWRNYSNKNQKPLVLIWEYVHMLICTYFLETPIKWWQDLCGVMWEFASRSGNFSLSSCTFTGRIEFYFKLLTNLFAATLPSPSSVKSLPVMIVRKMSISANHFHHRQECQSLQQS